MSDEKLVEIEISKAEFPAFAAALEPAKAASLTQAFNTASAELAQKDSRNAFIRYFDLEAGFGEAQVDGFNDAWLSVDKKGVSIAMYEGEFKALADAAKPLADAFATAASELARKEARNPVLNYFDLYSNYSAAPVAPFKSATLTVSK